MDAGWRPTEAEGWYPLDWALQETLRELRHPNTVHNRRVTLRHYWSTEAWELAGVRGGIAGDYEVLDWPLPERALVMIARGGTAITHPAEKAYGVYVRVRQPGDTVAAPDPEPAATRKDYRQGDDAIAEKMRIAIQHGLARNPTDAARMLVGDAEGEGTEDNKVVRLVRRYRANNPGS